MTFQKWNGFLKILFVIFHSNLPETLNFKNLKGIWEKFWKKNGKKQVSNVFETDVVVAAINVKFPVKYDLPGFLNQRLHNFFHIFFSF